MRRPRRWLALTALALALGARDLHAEPPGDPAGPELTAMARVRELLAAGDVDGALLAAPKALPADPVDRLILARCVDRAGAPRAATRVGAQPRDLAWCPDSKALAVAGRTSLDALVVGANGVETSQVLSSGPYWKGLAWSPRGDQLFAAEDDPENKGHLLIYGRSDFAEMVRMDGLVQMPVMIDTGDYPRTVWGVDAAGNMKYWERRGGLDVGWGAPLGNGGVQAAWVEHASRDLVALSGDGEVSRVSTSGKIRWRESVGEVWGRAARIPGSDLVAVPVRRVGPKETPNRVTYAIVLLDLQTRVRREIPQTWRGEGYLAAVGKYLILLDTGADVIHVFDWATSTLVRSTSPPKKAIAAFAVSGDPAFVWAMREDGALVVVHLETLAELETAAIPEWLAEVRLLAVSPDGAWLACALDQGLVVLLRLKVTPEEWKEAVAGARARAASPRAGKAPAPQPR